MNSGEKREPLSKEELFHLRKKKIINEIQAAKRILDKKIEPLKIADNLIHNSLVVMSDRIRKNNSGITNEDLKQKLKKLLNLNRQLKIKRKSFR